MIKCGKDKNVLRCYRKRRKTFYDLEDVHDCHNGISSIHEKELPEQLSIHCEHKRSYTQTNFRHIYKIGVWTRWDLRIVETIGCESHSWKYLSLIGDQRIINIQRTKVYVFSASVLCLGKIFEISQSNDAWEQRLGLLKTSSKYRNFDRIDGEPMEFEWNIFPGFNTLQLSEEVKRLLLGLGETPENFTWKILFLSMFNDISCGTKDNATECVANARLVSLCARIFRKGQWSFTGPGSEKKWYSISEDSPQGIWDKIAAILLLEFAESGCRSSRGDVWIVWNPSRENGETSCDGAIEFLTRAQCDQDRSTFGLWWPDQPRSSIATIWTTNWKAVTSRQIE